MRFRQIIYAFFTALVLTACNGAGHDITFSVSESGDSILLLPSKPEISPVCHAHIQLTLLNAAPDSRYAEGVKSINRYIIDHMLPDCKGASETDVAEQFVKSQIEDFGSEVKSFYYDNLEFFEENNDADDEEYADKMALFIEIHSYEYDITTEAHLGYADSLVCYTMNTYTYLGGAHPMLNSNTLTFSLSTGKPINWSDLFRPGTEPQLVDRLKKRLMEKVGAESMEELNDMGYLDIADMFITDNMLLEHDKVVFHYDPYDLAPYAMGPIDIELTYKEIEDLVI